MRKFMKKSKNRSDVSTIEVSSSALGVLTRAKTLALQKPCNSLPEEQEDESPSSETEYLELRSRKLEKSSALRDLKKHTKQTKGHTSGTNGNRNPSLSSKTTSSLLRGWNYLRSRGAASLTCSSNATMKTMACDVEDAGDLEFSFGENESDFEVSERSARESTPCSVIRSSESVGTPCPRRRSTASGRTGLALQGQIPDATEIEEFFAYAEEEQQRIFMEKYNFDVVHDLPLPGRYEWIPASP